MSSTTDLLVSLSQTIKAKLPVAYAKGTDPVSSIVSATHLILPPDLSVPKSSPTRYRKPGTSSTDPSISPQDFFSLEAIYLAWLLRDAPGAEYNRQSREHGLALGFVSITERKNVVDWLEGRTSENERIVSLIVESTTPPGTPPHRGSATAASTTSPRKPGATESSSPSKRRYVADPRDIEVVKKIKHNEIELQDRNTVLRGIKPNNFSALRTTYTDKLKKLKEASKSGMPMSTPAPSAENLYPIIMISSSPTALITMYNVKRFLQESTFELSADARARAAAEGNPRAEDLIPIDRRRTTVDSAGHERATHARYFVVDSVDALSKFGTDAWERVVCVMTTGQAWQFRPYRWSEPRTLFHHVKGIYVSWANDPPNTKIKDWNVTELKIDPHRRHVDKSVVAHFWKILDDWTMANKPGLMKS
ncbi:hypothetical protein SERLA73DRAFT_59315 [Serpula lacrymans var. lacrymans S7.3]|uniref:Cell division control protein 73 C-terminal domain-containing protein n=1 Tax=Serpula lacrymans var. lacrymans (strain S7.3) TaxID=936435 RepID=F8Q6V9_SERL3|nr:hypothetical protein SERLA73DRAFT_59315 [Serpula lacrymans var. lacrymans S7.3]